MKTTSYLTEQRRRKKWLYSPALAFRAETVAFATLGLVGLVGVVTAFVSGAAPARSREAPLAGVGRIPSVSYVRHGQFIADVRRGAARVDCCVVAEPPMATNMIAVAPTQKTPPVPKKTATVKRRA